MRSGRRADGEIRRSNVVLSAGPGAIVDLVDYAVILKGLDDWRYSSPDEGFIQEERLQAQASAMLRRTGKWAHPGVRLRRPPRCEDDASPNRGIHAREFPLWFVCRRCNGLVGRSALDERRRHTCTYGSVRPEAAVPVRFVSGCAHGHLHDIEWRMFVHRGPGDTEHHPFRCAIDPDHHEMLNDDGETWTADLVLRSSGSSGDLADLYVRCRRCGASRGLVELRTIPAALGRCLGWRPWLPSNDEACEQPLRLLVRTGSNVWFPQRLSVLSIPDRSDALRKRVAQRWSWFTRVETSRDLRNVLDILEDAEREFGGEDPVRLLDLILRRRAGLGDVQVPIREAEWEEITRSPYGHLIDLPPRGETWFARKVELSDRPPWLDAVVLVHALQEVRAILGFTRVEGATTGPEGEVEVGPATAPLAERADWVPAVEIQGEGIFLQFNEAALRAWEERPAVLEREAQFRRAMAIENAGRPGQQRAPSARLILLHSLAHMLITQISLECGYSASAIRERIYCYRDDDPARSRAGILLYTGTPGSEGTLGGLVEVGRDIARHLREVVEHFSLCANDPVCAQHAPDGPEDGRRREGAACHGCLLIAESSCERMNRDLDRAMVVPTLGATGAGFLG